MKRFFFLISKDIGIYFDFCFDSFIRSKHMYEVIYNRIISNLLLWVPSAPNNNTAKPQIKVAANNPLLNINMTESISIPFSMAKSNIIFGNIYHFVLLYF